MIAMLEIRKLAARSSMSFLIQQLNAADPMVQYQALITLAEMNTKGGDYGPGLDQIRKRPSTLQATLGRWWEREGKSLR